MIHLNKEIKMGEMKEVFSIIKTEAMEKSVFRRIGTGFVNKDDSMNIYLDAFPKDGLLHVRSPLEPRARDEQEAQGQVG